MHLDPFELHRPTTVEEAVALAQHHTGAVDFLAGGTDLLPNYKMHLNLKSHLISLDGIPELSKRSSDRIGVMTRLADLEHDGRFRTSYPGITAAVDEVATPLVRASATVGGNLMVETRCFFFNQSYFWRRSLGFCLKADGTACHVVPQTSKCYATFSGDLAPAFGVLDAEIEVASRDGRRRFPLLELYDAAGDGIRRNSLRPGELLVAVQLPPTASGTTATYRKLSIRPSFDFPELGLAAAARWDSDNLQSLTIVAGGLETFPKSFTAVTEPYVGGPLTEEKIREIAAAVQRSVRPVHNTFLPPDYRKRMTGVYVRRVLQDLVRAHSPGGSLAS